MSRPYLGRFQPPNHLRLTLLSAHLNICDYEISLHIWWKQQLGKHIRLFHSESASYQSLKSLKLQLKMCDTHTATVASPSGIATFKKNMFIFRLKSENQSLLLCLFPAVKYCSDLNPPLKFNWQFSKSLHTRASLSLFDETRSLPHTANVTLPLEKASS